MSIKPDDHIGEFPRLPAKQETSPPPPSPSPRFMSKALKFLPRSGRNTPRGSDAGLDGLGVAIPSQGNRGGATRKDSGSSFLPPFLKGLASPRGSITSILDPKEEGTTGGSSMKIDAATLTANESSVQSQSLRTQDTEQVLDISQTNSQNSPIILGSDEEGSPHVNFHPHESFDTFQFPSGEHTTTLGAGNEHSMSVTKEDTKNRDELVDPTEGTFRSGSDGHGKVRNSVLTRLQDATRQSLRGPIMSRGDRNSIATVGTGTSGGTSGEAV
ncbi:hypothetical protein TREMEDRAFT_59513 [Tremella mesenterica DSM 1558]|uniref:uncharacterized protein n=1 Tax=Tremella mesenterica (strain ATCC 24925 / CBS 8224 / DSM 1558 / NBRC 9311 / NRRL Y-6157 / RJB 2259-6 / UBC 559-6) TaxID=578456 RepID=UPI0003F48CF9|nr:uncharacterized protein TREMEDRAFT_59513 [Tremella mesenterica DSM 1558]EIW73347.1 hypothetical protein TREMEDRAFT_59513 [Tremella mesenterica DSM 1558]